MTTEFPPAFARQYESHLKHLKLKGLQPKTIDAYSRAIRRLGRVFRLPTRGLVGSAIDRVFQRSDRYPLVERGRWSS